VETVVASGATTTVVGTAGAGEMTVETATVGLVRRSAAMTVRLGRVGTTVPLGRAATTVRQDRAGMTVPQDRVVTTAIVASVVTVTVLPSGVTTVVSVGSA
jgi:ABC-type uncharacterized transport system ATPase subunit